MRAWMRLTGNGNKMPVMLLVSTLLMVVGCSTVRHRSPTWPTNLNVIELKGGGICLDKASAQKLAEFKAELEAI